MSLLGDVRSAYCACDASEGNHAQFCITTLKPRIVAVLDAIERFALAWDEHIEGVNAGSDVAADAINDAARALGAALRGEEAP